MPDLAIVTDVSLLLLRLLIAAVFATSGWAHATQPEERAESIGMSPGVTLLLGIIELAGAVSVALGIFAPIGAIVLGAVMLGAIGKKMFVWKSGFWGKKNDGWYYDLLYLACSLVIASTGGGRLTLI